MYLVISFLVLREECVGSDCISSRTLLIFLLLISLTRLIVISLWQTMYYLCDDTTKISEHFCYPKSVNLVKCRLVYSS